MWELEKIAKVLKNRILKLEEGLDSKLSILFCGKHSFQNRDLHIEAKKAGFQPFYSMKHPTIKVLIKRAGSRKIDTDKFKTNIIDIEKFWYKCRHIFIEKLIINFDMNGA